MGYTKAVRSGNLLELYEFTKARTDNSRYIKRQNERIKRRDEDAPRRSDNIRATRRLFRRIVRANLGGTECVAFLTLTMYACVSKRASGFAYTQFIQRLRIRYGRHIRCLGVPEKQKRGAWHFHAIVIGLNEETLKKERLTRNIGRLWGYGTCDVIHTDGSTKLVGYLTKYMSKGLQVKRPGGKGGVQEQMVADSGGKAYFITRNVMRPMSVGSNSFDIARDLVVPVDNSPLYDRVYMTKWLGSCHYQCFVIPTEYGNENPREGA